MSFDIKIDLAEALDKMPEDTLQCTMLNAYGEKPRKNSQIDEVVDNFAKLMIGQVYDEKIRELETKAGEAFYDESDIKEFCKEELQKVKLTTQFPLFKQAAATFYFMSGYSFQKDDESELTENVDADRFSNSSTPVSGSSSVVSCETPNSAPEEICEDGFESANEIEEGDFVDFENMVSEDDEDGFEEDISSQNSTMSLATEPQDDEFPEVTARDLDNVHNEFIDTLEEALKGIHKKFTDRLEEALKGVEFINGLTADETSSAIHKEIDKVLGQEGLGKLTDKQIEVTVDKVLKEQIEEIQSMQGFDEWYEAMGPIQKKNEVPLDERVKKIIASKEYQKLYEETVSAVRQVLELMKQDHPTSFVSTSRLASFEFCATPRAARDQHLS